MRKYYNIVKYMNLLSDMIENGGTNEELADVFEYIGVLYILNAMKDKPDMFYELGKEFRNLPLSKIPEYCEKKNKIDYYTKKYQIRSK